MASSVQVTSMKIGNAQAISRTFPNVDVLTYNFGDKIIQIEPVGEPPVIIDIDAAATITHTISAKQHTIAIS